MKLEKGEISSSQLMLLVVSFLQGAHLLIGFAITITKHDSWITVLAAVIISIPIVWIYGTLVQKFPGKSLIQIYDIIYGPYLGKFISLLYIWNFFILAALNMRLLANFVRTYMMPETPMAVILIMFIVVCAWAVRKGIEVLARLSFTFVVITLALVLTVTVLLLKDINLANFLPVFEIPVYKFIQGTHVIASVPFCQTIVFTMITPYLNKVRQAKRAILLGLILGGIQLLIIVSRDTAVLGNIAPFTGIPSFQATRSIEIGQILTRMDILVAIVMLITLFLRISIFYYSSVLGLAQLLHLRSYSPLVFPMAIIITNFAILVYDSSVEHAQFSSSIWAVYAAPLDFFIPVVSLIIAVIRGLPKKQSDKSI